MRILVLGHKGMLGHLVEDYLSGCKEASVSTIEHRWPTNDFKTEVINSNIDFVVNCIGSIPQKTNDFSPNIELPMWLEENLDSSIRIIHPGTDCEIDNDEYGTSKRKASEFIQKNSKRTRIIQTSIIGPELSSSAGLFGWFMSENNKVGGWTSHMWNGNTTLEWSHHCWDIINNWENYETLTVVEGQTVSKFEILTAIKKVFKKDIVIEAVETEAWVNKCLSGELKTKSLESQLKELKDYMQKRETKYEQYFAA